MYQGISLPNAGSGTGAAAAVMATHDLSWAFSVLAGYTLVMAGMALWRLRPVQEK